MSFTDSDKESLLFDEDILMDKISINGNRNNYQLDNRTTILISIPKFFRRDSCLHLEETR